MVTLCLSSGDVFVIFACMVARPTFQTISAVIALSAGALADDWPQWLGPKRDGFWRETGIIEKFPENGPKIRWRVAVGGGFSGPAVVDGRVYLTDRQLKSGAKGQGNPFDRARIDGT